MGPRWTPGTLLRSGALFFALGPLALLWPGLRGCTYFIPRFEEALPRIDKSSTVYLQAAELFRSSPLVTSRFGQPLVEGEVDGETFPPIDAESPFPGAPFAHFTASVSGPAGRGKVHAVANLIEGDWRFSALSLVLDGSAERVSLLPPPPREAQPLRPGPGKFYLVALGKLSRVTLDPLPGYFRHRFGLEVVRLPELPLDLGLRAPQKDNPHAVEADKVIEYLKRSFPEVVADPEAVLIGVTDSQLAAKAFGWSRSFTIRRQGRFAVISTQLMGPWTPTEAANPEVVQVRLRKVLLKDVGLLYFKLPLSSDPTSVLLTTIGSTTSLDLMTEEFLGARGLWQSDSAGEAPCLSITRFPDGRYTWLEGYDRLPPSDTHLHRFSFCPGYGMFAQQQVDFFLPEPFPLALRRLYRTKDDLPRAFGVGNNHSLDVFLVGSAPRWVDLVLEDGGRVSFERATPPPGRPNTFFRAVDGGREFAGATMEWNGRGWDLERRDGWIFVFPASQKATRSQQAALTGIRHRDGRAFRIERDGHANLLLVAAPEGESLRFDYDSAERLRRISHSGGRWVDYGYDREGRLVRVRDSAGQTAAYSYDSKGRMAGVEIPAGRLFLRNEYDEAGWLSKQTLADGATFRYSYVRKEGDDKPEQITVTDPDGFVTVIRRTPAGYLTSFPQPPSAASEPIP